MVQEKQEIIELFKSGKASEEQWKAMADSIWFVHHGQYSSFVACIMNEIIKE